MDRDIWINILIVVLVVAVFGTTPFENGSQISNSTTTETHK